MKPVWKRIAWEIIMVLVVALGAYEIAGLDARFNGHAWYYPLIHTISYEAYLHPWLRWVVAIGALLFVIIFEIWWRHHAATPHAKLYVSKKRLKEYEDYMEKYGKKK